MSTQAETVENRAVAAILQALEQARQGRIVDRKIIEGFVADVAAAVAGRLSQSAPRGKHKVDPEPATP
jgi:hypothetical protein